MKINDRHQKGLVTVADLQLMEIRTVADYTIRR